MLLVSVLNESYGDARANTEECAEELEMARFIEQRLTNIFHEESNRTEFKLFCDETTFSNMCRSEAEPFCLNSESIIQCTEERMLNVEKRLFLLSRRTENFLKDHLKEENYFMELFLSLLVCLTIKS